MCTDKNCLLYQMKGLVRYRILPHRRIHGPNIFFFHKFLRCFQFTTPAAHKSRLLRITERQDRAVSRRKSRISVNRIRVSHRVH